MAEEHPAPEEKPGKALVVINERLQELALIPDIDKQGTMVAEKMMAGGGMALVGGFVAIAILGAIIGVAFPTPAAVVAAPAWACLMVNGAAFSGLASIAGGIVSGAAGVVMHLAGFKTKGEKRRLALRDERDRLLLEQKNHERSQRMAEHRKEQEEKAQRRDRLEKAALARLKTVADDDLHGGFVTDLRDPDDASRTLHIGVTEAIICDIGGQKTRRVTARLYNLDPDAPGELLKAPQIDGMGPIHIKRLVMDWKLPTPGR